MKNKDLIDIVREMAFSGSDYESIEKELELNKSKYSDEALVLAIDKINDHIVNFQLASQEKSKALYHIIFGLSLFLIGVGVTGYTYFENIDQYVLAYGAILTGAWTLKEGYKTYRKPIEELTPQNRIFRK